MFNVIFLVFTIENNTTTINAFIKLVYYMQMRQGRYELLRERDPLGECWFTYILT